MGFWFVEEHEALFLDCFYELGDRQQHNFVPGAELSEDRRQLVQHFVGVAGFDQVSKAHGASR